MAKVRKRTWESKGVTRQAWVVDYTDRQGVRRMPQYKLKRDADAALVKISGELQAGTHTPSAESKTVREAAELWYKRCLAKNERATMRDYRRFLDTYILPTLGRHKLSALTKPGVALFRDHLEEKTSKITARKVLIALKGILKEAELRGMVSQNVALGVTVEISDRDTERLEIGNGIPTKEEVKRMIAAAEGRWRPFVVVLAFAGLRASEARGLTWDNVDLEKRTITVRQRADRFNDIGAPKSKAGRRTIPLGPLVTNVLTEWRLRLPKGKSNLVFPSQADTPLLHSNIVNLWFRPLQRKLEIVDSDGNPKYGLHALRHFCASYWIDLEFQPKKIQEMMGHASVTMTYDRYGHLFPSPEADQAKLEKGELSILA